MGNVNQQQLAGIKDKLAERAQVPVQHRDPADTIRAYLEKMKGEIAKALPRHITPERLARVALTTIRTNPKLLECNVQSLMAGVMLSAQLGLEPGPLGLSWLVPYGSEAQFIIGYRGYLELMWRSGQLKSVAVHEVCENDEFEFEYGLSERLRHKPLLTGDRGKVIAYYLVAHYLNGGHFVHVMSREDIEKHRERSRAKNAGPWLTDYDAMAKKTVVRAAARWMPLSVEVQRALSFDEAAPADVSEVTEGAAAPVIDVVEEQVGEETPAPGDPEVS